MLEIKASTFLKKFWRLFGLGFPHLKVRRTRLSLENTLPLLSQRNGSKLDNTSHRVSLAKLCAERGRMRHLPIARVRILRSTFVG